MRSLSPGADASAADEGAAEETASRGAPGGRRKLVWNGNRPVNSFRPFQHFVTTKVHVMKRHIASIDLLVRRITIR